MRSVLVMCSWCHTMNEHVVGARLARCRGCGHRPDRARSLCDCRRCRKYRGEGERSLPQAEAKRS
jgi:hypothetical protein